MLFNEEYFDAGLYRMNTNCIKWDLCRKEHGADTLPMWVADMDFPVPPAVAQAITTRAAHPTFGYTDIGQKDWDALIGFWERRHGLSLRSAALLSLPCVVTGMKLAINALTEKGDGVMILSPVYGPFRMSIEATGRTLVDCPLIYDEVTGRYDIDFEKADECLAKSKMLLLCNPHNPAGRVWSREELEKLLAMAKKHSVPVVSDEIHADFVFSPAVFTPVLSLEKENTVMLCAPSKTFNLAGLQQASLACFDEKLAEKLKNQLNASGITSGNIFAIEAARAAYTEGDAWLDGLLDYIAGNIRELEAAVKEYLPKAVLTPMDATYLGWLNMKAYGFTTNELMQRAFDHGVAFTGGTFFGDGGEGFLRVNLGCPRRNIREAIRRLSEAVQ